MLNTLLTKLGITRQGLPPFTPPPVPPVPPVKSRLVSVKAFNLPVSFSQEPDPMVEAMMNEVAIRNLGSAEDNL